MANSEIFKGWKTVRHWTVILAMSVSFAALLNTAPAYAEEDLIGADEYLISCASCHGVGGKGDGPMAQYLTVLPTDLTQVTKSNDGVFPVLEMFQIIDGRTELGAHGVRHTEGWEMPVWGSRYKEEAGTKYGPYGGEQAVRARILELVFYVQAIQDQ